MVDHQKMKIKLHMEGIDRRSWQLVDNLYTELSEMVQWKGKLSSTFNIMKGVRQGAILSTSLYKMYINDLLLALEKSGTGMHIGSIYIGTPTCADDQLLIANESHDMQAMLCAVHDYSTQNLYKIHPNKSTVTNMSSKTNCSQVYKLGDDTLPEANTFTHLGLEWKSNRQVPDITSKITLARRAAYALIGAGMHGGNGLSPAVSRKIINAYIVPRLLYGLDAVRLTRHDIDDLNDYHRNLLRQVQGLPRYVATEAIYLLSGTLPLEAELHIRVLNLFGAICRSENDTMKQLASRQMSIGSQYSWFTYVQQLCQNYGISTEASLTAPWRKQAWKRYVEDAVRGKWTKELLLNKAGKSSLVMLQALKPSEYTPHPIWESCIQNPRYVNAAVTRARLITGTYQTMKQNAKMDKKPTQDTCILCSEEPEDICHMMMRCKALDLTRRPGLELLAREGFTIVGMDAAATTTLLNGPTIPSRANLNNKNNKNIQLLISTFCHKMHLDRLNRLSTSGVGRVYKKGRLRDKT